jgi:uncharacterized protein
MRDGLVICNTSPLLYLNLVGQLDILPALYHTVTIPPAVRAELLVGRQQGVQIPEIDDLSWLVIVALKDRTLIPLVTDLGAGEAEVIGLAKEYPNSRLILDDTLGRRIASVNKLTFTGTVGVIIKAKQAGLVPTVKPIVQALRQAGLWLSDDLIQNVLHQAGE